MSFPRLDDNHQPDKIYAYHLFSRSTHLNEAVKIFSEKHHEVHVLNARSFEDSLSLDGIDVNAHRLLEEENPLDAAILALNGVDRRVTHISITGYSLGGLIARYLIGLLFLRGFFDKVQPMNYTSFTTPHVGIPPPPYSSKFWFSLGTALLGRSGAQLHLSDTYGETGRPLLSAMAHPESSFCRGLALFKNVAIYSNAINDVTVRYVSGAIEESDPYAKHSEDEMLPVYIPEFSPLIQSFSLRRPPARPWLRKPRKFDGPLTVWSFPWNMILYLCLPLLIAFWFLYLAIYCPIVLYASEKRVKELLPRLETPPEMPCVSEVHSDAPEMSPVQLGMVRGLNSVTALKKYSAFRPGIRNSHGMIICLESGWEDHQVGRGVLRHWANEFVVL
ncbi:F-box domain-containing protein [Mycena indigotica]|uniref:F-box domain-containing protein n=1 Tax=Mycena indigotica TaxID=2126181 RepID=A0A8H6T2G5_9AGAR|nr:F-box domain-containing protein [Mycena indigotica]KAF7309816.1 F-box domain-containing protein [Mycena indigotica]